MGRPFTLPEPLATLACKAGSEKALQVMMGVSSSTFQRWRRMLLAGRVLPASGRNAIAFAKAKLRRRRIQEQK